MCDTYDITYSDLNPTLLFAGKTHITETRSMHRHDRTEIMCILSGSQQYQIEDTVYDVSAGDIIVLNAGIMHRSIVTSDADPALVFFTGVTDFHFKNMKPNCIHINGCPIIHTISQQRQEMIGICLRMVAERYTEHVGQYFMQKSYLIQLMLLVIRHILAAPVKKPAPYPFETYHKSYVVNEIRNYLNENYTEKISLDLIAKNMYLSSAYISKIFKEETGEAPINYLIKLRLEKAKEQLERKDDTSIKLVSTNVGYDDVYYFSKLFKKYYGMSPMNYRSCYKKIS